MLISRPPNLEFIFTIMSNQGLSYAVSNDEDKSRCWFFFFQIFLGVSLGVGIIAGLMTLCVFYLGLFVLGRYGRVRSKILTSFCLTILQS